MAFLARSARNALLELRPTTSSPTFLLPFRATITTASHNFDASKVPDSVILPEQDKSKDAIAQKQTQAPKPVASSPPKSIVSAQIPKQNALPTPITPTIRHLLPLLHSQPSHYMTIHIHGHPYLVTKGDTVRLPFLMPLAKPGDILRLNRATHIGSRDYTLKAPQPIKGTADHAKKILYLDERMFLCRARVVAIDTEPMRVEEKTKRRQRHVKHVKSKMRFTVLKISELEVRSLEEYEKILSEN